MINQRITRAIMPVFRASTEHVELCSKVREELKAAAGAAFEAGEEQAATLLCDAEKALRRGQEAFAKDSAEAERLLSQILLDKRRARRRG